jgi:glycosyltransferase involved in cell wall biosynthesis
MGYLNNYSVESVIKKVDISNAIHPKNDKNPKISIVIASYNQAKYLERTILSILNQKYNNFEILIIDGGSKDGSVEIIKYYEQFIQYWVSEKDNGQTDAINKGLKIATGDLLCFQNSDDLFCENAFQTVANYYTKNPNFEGYFGDLLFIDANDNVLDILKASDFDIKSQVIEGVQIFNQSFFFKKSMLEKLGYLDENLRFVLDYENVLRWAFGGAKFKKVDQLMGAFRMHEEAKTSNLQPVREKEHETVKQEYLGKIFKNKENIKFEYVKLRLQKIAYFIKKRDFSYMAYRYSIKK